MLRTFFAVATGMCRKSARSGIDELQSSWNVMAHGDALEEKWRGNWGMEWVSSTLHTTSEHGVSSITTITTADVHTSAASSRLNWRLRPFKWTFPFTRKTKSGFCACAITFQTQSTSRPIVVHVSYLLISVFSCTRDIILFWVAFVWAGFWPQLRDVQSRACIEFGLNLFVISQLYIA